MKMLHDSCIRNAAAAIETGAFSSMLAQNFDANPHTLNAVDALYV